MKKLSYLFAILGLFAFTACGGGATDNSAEEATEVAVCSNTGEPCLEDHSCCAVKEEASCCCGDETCDGSCHAEEGHAHEHDHDGEGHDHEHDHSDSEEHDHEH